MDTNQEILEIYQELMHLEGLRAKSIHTYRQHLKDFFMFSKDLTDDMLLRYMIEKKERVDAKTVSKTHYNQVYYAFQKFYRGIYQRELPSKLKPLKIPFKEPPYVAPDTLLEARKNILTLRDRIIFDLALSSMMRRTEIQQLKWEDIDKINRIVTITEGKGGKPRKTIISRITIDDLQKFMEEKLPEEKKNSYVFSAYNSSTNYVGKSTIYNAIVGAGENISQHWWTHLMRHAGTNVLGEADVNAKKIQDLLGHARLETTQRYLNLSQRKTLQTTSPLDMILLPNNSSDNANEVEVNANK